MGHKEIGSHIGPSGFRVYDGENNTEPIPHQSGNCERYEDHHLVKVGTVTIGGVDLKKVECRKPGCNFTSTVPMT